MRVLKLLISDLVLKVRIKMLSRYPCTVYNPNLTICNSKPRFIIMINSGGFCDYTDFLRNKWNLISKKISEEKSEPFFSFTLSIRHAESQRNFLAEFYMGQYFMKIFLLIRKYQRRVQNNSITCRTIIFVKICDDFNFRGIRRNPCYR